MLIGTVAHMSPEGEEVKVQLVGCAGWAFVHYLCNASAPGFFVTGKQCQPAGTHNMQLQISHVQVLWWTTCTVAPLHHRWLCIRQAVLHHNQHGSVAAPYADVAMQSAGNIWRNDVMYQLAIYELVQARRSPGRHEHCT